ncbi:DUF5134 domain-containing protein [Streptomyces sp. NPDC091268]|uniref:DUF5134 domain-containing protein n=1 Tax=Streptomyces sp. NPDC091268 TaxID=3365979 RepID=UPI0037F21A51
MSPSSTVSAWLLVLLCAGSGAYCLGRVRRSAGGPGGGSGAAGEALMGFGMALMALPLGLGGSWQAPVLGAVFCAAALHAVWLLRGGVHHAHHLVGSLTMVYMALTAAGSGTGAASGHGHGGAAGPPLLTGVLLLYYAGYVVLGGARLVTAGAAAGPAGPIGAGAGAGSVRGPGDRSAGGTELIRACRLAMGTGMLAMLLTM